MTDFNGTPPTEIIRMKQYKLTGKTSYKIKHLNIQSWTTDGLLLFVRPVMCEGDSGAPALDKNGMLVAIVVGITSSDCIGGVQA